MFSLNNDGSISAFIPVTSDTIRYLVDGLTYGRGSTPLPTADEYNFNKDHGFESVLYKDLPEDSLEIRYTPGRDIPYERPLPKDVNPQKIVLSSFISFKNQEDKNWIQPLSLLQPYTRTFHIIGWEMSKGIPVQIQKEVQKKYGGTVFNTNLGEVFEEIKRDLNQDKIHLQQKAILTVSYASILGWMEHKTRFQKRRNEQQITEFNPDKEIINSILEIVPPSHPAWRYNNGAVDYLLTETDDPQKFTDYSRQVVVFHPDERAVRSIAVSLIRHFGSDYSSVEEMPVYQIILERYGKNEVARAAYQAFDFSHLED